MSTPNPVPTEPTTTPPGVPASPVPAPPPLNTPSVPTSKWPETWRQEMTGGDEKELKQAERYLTPADVWKKARALEQRLSSGELKAITPFPDKGTPDQQNAWRAENGIPEAPDKYQLNLKSGLVIGDNDKPIIDDFLKSAHAANLPPAAASAAVQWYFDFQQKDAELAAQETAQTKKSVEDTLRTEWGNDYRTNQNAIENLLNGRLAPDSPLRKLIKGGMETNADFAKFMAGIVREINPVTTLVPGSTESNIASSIDDEVSKIEKFMRTDRKAYNNDQKMQDRYRQLLAARAKAKGQ